jgi:hypothetical protein
MNHQYPPGKLMNANPDGAEQVPNNCTSNSCKRFVSPDATSHDSNPQSQVLKHAEVHHSAKDPAGCVHAGIKGSHIDQWSNSVQKLILTLRDVNLRPLVLDPFVALCQPPASQLHKVSYHHSWRPATEQIPCNIRVT